MNDPIPSVSVTYARSGVSTRSNELGMRPMQERAAEGFDALVTVDRGIEHQQNVSELPIPVVIMLAHRNRLAELQPLVPYVASLFSDPLENRIYRVPD